MTEYNQPQSSGSAGDDSGPERPAGGRADSPRPGSYPEIAPGVPRYGQYAPPGYQAPGTGTASAPARPEQPNAPQPARSADSARPPAVTRSAVLIWLAGGLHALLIAMTTVVLFSPQYRSTIIDQLRTMVDDDPQLMAQAQDPAFWTSFIVGWLVVGAVTVGCYAWVGWKIRAGRAWARVLGTVLAILSLVMLFGSIWGVIQVALGFLGIFSAWSKSTQRYFAANSARRG